MQEHWGKTDKQIADGTPDRPLPSKCPPAGTEWVQLLELIWSTDLKNAYGNVYRSAQLRGTRHLTPWLSAFLANKWVNRSNTQWQRVHLPDKQYPVWRSHQATRGGGQGSRLMMTTFSVGLAWTIIEGVKDFYQAKPKNYEDAGYSAIKHIGVQDDQYFRVPAAVFPLFSQIMEGKLARDGHILQPAKCAVWIPALDCMWNEASYPPEITEITSRFQLVKGGIQALGTFAQGCYTTHLKIKHVGIHTRTCRWSGRGRTRRSRLSTNSNKC